MADLKALRDWPKSFFREDIFSPGAAGAVAQAPKEAAFAAKVLGLRKGGRVLDLCCGTGRHTLELARRGQNVVGLDATDAYLNEARRLCRGLKSVRLMRGDMRRLSFHGEFDAAINLWTSFGYFLKPADDLRVLKGIKRALKPGGKFLIDLMNGEWLERHFEPKRWDKLDDGSFRLEDVRIQNGRDWSVINHWTVIRPGRDPVSAVFFLRLYDRKRLSQLLRRAGLIPLKAWGGFDGRRLSADAPRLIVLAGKPLDSK